MDKYEYVSKMELLLADKTSFERLNDDPTTTLEGSLVRLLLRLLKE
ncbi:unnamed protein product, partial [Rotaria socialis]